MDRNHLVVRSWLKAFKEVSLGSGWGQTGLGVSAVGGVNDELSVVAALEAVGDGEARGSVGVPLPVELEDGEVGRVRPVVRQPPDCQSRLSS